MPGQHKLIEIPSGINPVPDNTNLQSITWTDGDKVRFVDKRPQKLGGWTSFGLDVGQSIQGVPRNIFGFVLNNLTYRLIGTHTKLYALIGSRIFNITPLKTELIILPNNPISTTSGSLEISITVKDISQFTIGDRIKLQGLTGFNGVNAEDFNREFIIKDIIGSNILVDLFVTPTGTGSGGGNLGTIQDEIDIGNQDAFVKFGYGAGRYGVGRYGVSKKSTISNVIAATAWVFDKFGDFVMITRGQQTPLYFWDGDVEVAPQIVPNSPPAINYVYVTSNIVVTYGADGQQNRKKWSDIGDFTVWAPDATNFAREDDIEDAGEFLAAIEINSNTILEFTENKIFLSSFIGGDFVFSTQLLEPNRGIIAKFAGVSVGGIAYWMGNDDFYTFNGGIVRPIPSPGNVTSSVRRYVFDNLNSIQKSKIHCFYNRKFNEIWWFYPTENSIEIDRYVIYNIGENHWSIGTLDRTATERSPQLGDFPILADSGGLLYRHEDGFNDTGPIISGDVLLENGTPLLLEDDSGNVLLEDQNAEIKPMNSFVTTNFAQIQEGTKTLEIFGIMPDSYQIGNISMDIITKLTPQESLVTTIANLPISETTDKVDFIATGRVRKYTFRNNELNADWRMGAWTEIIQEGTDE